MGPKPLYLLSRNFLSSYSNHKNISWKSHDYDDSNLISKKIGPVVPGLEFTAGSKFSSKKLATEKEPRTG